MTWRDELGDMQSPTHKAEPTKGANPKMPEDFQDGGIGGNKHSTTGGSRDAFSDNPGEVERSAAANHGVQKHNRLYEDNFDEGGPGDVDSIGASRKSGSID